MLSRRCELALLIGVLAKGVADVRVERLPLFALPFWHESVLVVILLIDLPPPARTSIVLVFLARCHHVPHLFRLWRVTFELDSSDLRH